MVALPGRARRRFALRPGDARRHQRLDHPAVVRLVQELPHRARDHRADVGHLQQGLLARLQQALQIAEMPREIACRSLADVADAERIDEALEGRSVCERSSAASRFAADFSAMRSRSDELRQVELVEVCGRVHEALARPAGRRGLSPRPSMSIARRLAKCSSACLRCAGQKSPPLQRATASSSLRTTAESQMGHSDGHSKTCRIRRPLLGPHRDDLRDHVAGTAHDHGVADRARPCARSRPRCAASRSTP